MASPHDARQLEFPEPTPRPRKNIFCAGHNYRAHIIEGNLARRRPPDALPKALDLFTKPPHRNGRPQSRGQPSRCAVEQPDFDVAFEGRDPARQHRCRHSQRQACLGKAPRFRYLGK